nr:putative leucine-rich repeat protein, plant-type [Tanacetum cinerariifolium]
MGGYISVQFEDDFEELAEVLGLERSDGLDIRRFYLDYLEPLVSNYKATRSSNPTGGYEDEGIRRFEDYHGDGNKDGSTAAKEKARVEHFGITLEKEEKGKCDATAHQDKKDMARIKCYLCQKTGHFNGECPNEDQRPTNGASTSGPIKEENTQSISRGSPDLFIKACQTLLFAGPNTNHVLCKDVEREALLEFKNGLIDHPNKLASWVGLEEECCSWFGIVCDNYTGHVHQIHLPGLDGHCRVEDYTIPTEYDATTPQMLGGDISQSLLNLKQLKHLDLSCNDFGGIEIPTFMA